MPHDTTMASIPRDDNHVPVIAGVSSADSVTPVSPFTHPVTRRLYVDATTDSKVPTTIVQDGTKTTSGTNVAVQLVASSTPCQKVVVYAYAANANTVAVGTSTVVAEAGSKTGRGEQLMQGAATSISITDASKVWLASASNGDGVSYIIYN